MESMHKIFKNLQPKVDFCSLRVLDETSEQWEVQRHVLQAPKTRRNRGAMVTVVLGGGLGYTATADLSEAGLRAAVEQAKAWADYARHYSRIDFSAVPSSTVRGEYDGPGVGTALCTEDVIALLQHESQAAKVDARIVDWQTSLTRIASEQLYFNSAGAAIRQRFHYMIPNVQVSANEGLDTQTRSLGGQYNGYCQQGGLDVLQRAGFDGAGARVAHDALELLAAENCPTGKMDLLLLPSQMMLQLHESIGHPLELDRILGDERNFAGTSFVTADMFGHFQYGSKLLNVTYDPTHGAQFASYAWDDDGQAAEKTWLIRNGVLERPLGSHLSQARSGLAAVANARACSWNRPPIDRMANLNIEPGDTRLQDMIASIEYGIMMDTNVSWSIDDSRNKFQFGCEYGRLIVDGELKGVLKNPNYRGISQNFWRSLKAVGDRSTFEVMGTPFCGKGEPTQIVRVGHAAPACLFDGVEVFGGTA